MMMKVVNFLLVVDTPLDGGVEFGEDMAELLKYNPKKDPYLKGTQIETLNDLDDFLIRDSDLVILAGVSEDEEVSHLDVYIFESAEVSITLVDQFSCF